MIPLSRTQRHVSGGKSRTRSSAPLTFPTYLSRLSSDCDVGSTSLDKGPSEALLTRCLDCHTMPVVLTMFYMRTLAGQSAARRGPL